MPNKDTRFDRLRQLAEHLIYGQLGHKEFDFSIYNRDGGPHSCGTAGCAIGECPIVWPDKWEFDLDGDPSLKVDGSYQISAASEFFAISMSAALHLFYPFDQDPEVYGGRLLRGTATKEEVAANIIAFCNRFEPEFKKEVANA